MPCLLQFIYFIVNYRAYMVKLYRPTFASEYNIIGGVCKLHYLLIFMLPGYLENNPPSNDIFL